MEKSYLFSQQGKSGLEIPGLRGRFVGRFFYMPNVIYAYHDFSREDDFLGLLDPELDSSIAYMDRREKVGIMDRWFSGGKVLGRFREIYGWDWKDVIVSKSVVDSYRVAMEMGYDSLDYTMNQRSGEDVNFIDFIDAVLNFDDE